MRNNTLPEVEIVSRLNPDKILYGKGACSCSYRHMVRNYDGECVILSHCKRKDDVMSSCGAKHDKNTCAKRRVHDVIPLPVRPGKIVMCQQTFEAHGQKRPQNLMLRSTVLIQGMATAKPFIVATRGLTPKIT